MRTSSAYPAWSISSEGGANTAWRIYEGQSLPLLASFMKAKGTVSVEYAYDKNGTSTKSVAAAPRTATADVHAYGLDDVPSMVYSSSPVDPCSVSYLGMNADGSDVSVGDRQNVYTGAGTDATKFALLFGDQQGYDLYGNNFTINKRSIAFTDDHPPSFHKIYDGSADATDALKQALATAEDGALTGILDRDKHHVTVTLATGDGTLGIKATYGAYDSNAPSWVPSANAGTHSVKIEGASGATVSFGPKTDSAADREIAANYLLTAESAAAMNKVWENAGAVAPRSIVVSLYQSAGIDKTYDGTADLTDENIMTGAGAPATLVGAGNIRTDVDGTGLTEQQVSNLITRDFGDGGVALASGIASKYVGNDGATPATNVLDTADTSKNHVAYTGIKLATGGNADNAINYRFTDGTGPLPGSATDGYMFMAEGKITPRNFLSSDFRLGNGMVSKPYDGNSVFSGAPSGTAVAVSHLVTATNAKMNLAGLLASDAANVKFVTSETANFCYKDGDAYINTADATSSGLVTAATNVRYDVRLDESSDATALQNYTVDNAALATDSTFHIVETGTITKRDITVALRQADRIDREYDGTAAVAGKSADGMDYATANWKNVAGSLVDNDGTSISIKNATYKGREVAYKNGGVIAQDITYTVAVSGAKAANYNLNDTNMTTAQLSAAGTIRPKLLEITVPQDCTTVAKLYDGNADVSIGDIGANVEVTGWVAGDVARYGNKDAGLFDWSGVTAQYGNGASDAVAFKAQTDVGQYDVKYEGIQEALKDRNYTVSNTSYGKGAIMSKRIALTDLQAKASPKNNFDKTYDGLSYYNGASSLKADDYFSIDYETLGVLPKDVSGVTNGMKQKITFARAVYDGKDAGAYTSGVAATYNIGSGTMGDWMSVGNYAFDMGTITVRHSGTIFPKEVTVALAGQPALSKTYDGTTNLLDNNGAAISNATAAGWFAASGTVNGEKLTVSDVSGRYADKNVGTGKTIYYANIALDDGMNGKVSNYRLKSNEATGIGNITVRRISAADAASVTKVYDGNNQVTAPVRITVNNTTQAGRSDWDVLADDGFAERTTGFLTGNVAGKYLSTTGEGAENVRRIAERAVGAKDVSYNLQSALGDNYVIAGYTAKGGGTVTPVSLAVDAPNAVQMEYNAKTLLDAPEDSFKNSATLADLMNKNALTVTGNYHINKMGTGTVNYTLKLSEGVNAAGNNYNFVGCGDNSMLVKQGDIQIIPRQLFDNYTTVKEYDGTRRLRSVLQWWFAYICPPQAIGYSVDNAKYVDADAGLNRTGVYSRFLPKLVSRIEFESKGEMRHPQTQDFWDILAKADAGGGEKEPSIVIRTMDDNGGET